MKLRLGKANNFKIFIPQKPPKLLCPIEYENYEYINFNGFIRK